jgi:hypothetical protein
VSKRRNVGDPAPIHELLPSVLRGLRGAATGPVEQVRREWAAVVGPEVASRTRVAAVENGRVRVEVESAALKHDLATFRNADVVRGLRERLPELGIRDVSYRVAAVS